MKIIVWGLGYVGTVVAACFAKLGHDVVGVDKVPAKVEALNQGKSPIKEPGLTSLIKEAVEAGSLRAVSEGAHEIADADVSLICVGTPSAPDGSTGLQYIKGVAAEIGDGLRQTNRYHVVVLRSTVFPGTTNQVLLPLLEQHSQKTCGQDFGLVMNPEFLRESTAIADFYEPPYTVIGEFDQKSGDVIEKLYQGITGDFYRVSIKTAELLKQTNNAFHALKIGFANEIGRLCAPLDLDSHELMAMVCADTKLNIAPTYMRPGFAFGGSCLPKDLRSITFHAQQLGVDLPILNSVLPSNEEQIAAARLRIHEFNIKQVTILGLSFKANTDDLRESPVLTLINQLWRDGLDVRVYDPDVQLEKLIGGSRQYLERQVPQINQICFGSLEEALKESKLVVLTQKRPEFSEAALNLPENIPLIDLVQPHLSHRRTSEVLKFSVEQPIKVTA
ncbi:MAG: UDP-glucose/GDP-mannose dehydrogenase family protein [Xenococcaceae cyanobacterium MO_234.B1]|nr:UDP-glucose/GDP-mannose dehydrogenase family protein [Xenococcaceae cyanobacterium MO_234.B1]